MKVSWETIRPRIPTAPAAAADILDATLHSSSALDAFLREAGQRGQSPLLLVNDPHRSTLTRETLAALARLLNHPGRTRLSGAFRALVATGTHRFTTGEKRAFEQATFADSGLPVHEIAWHDVADTACLAQVGAVRMHRWVTESRWLLPIGSVEPHYFAGLTGPHKTATIGVMGREDIERNHAGALDPASDILRLDGNPVHEGIASVLREMQRGGWTVCGIAQLVCGERLLEAAVGDPLEVLDALHVGVERAYVHRAAQPADILHLQVPMPLGRSLYQADKGIKNNHLAVRDGGGIILEAACPEGIGQDAFMALLRNAKGFAAARAAVEKDGYRLGDHKAVKMHYLTDPTCRNVRVAVVSSGLTPADLAGTPLQLFETVDGSMDWLGGALTGSTMRGVVIEDAGMVCVLPMARDD